MQSSPAHEPPPTVSGEYLPPPAPQRGAAWARAGTGAVGIGVLLLKAKGLLLVLLNFKWLILGGKLLFSSLTLLASIWFYALLWGWKFAIVFVLLILVHESGHAIFMRAFGVPASLPYFIPGFGALIAMKGRPASVLEEAYIALAGPLVGSLGAFTCYIYGVGTQDPFWLAAAYTGFFLNLFNLFPVLPLDGGRVIGAVSPRVWVFGLVALIVAAVALHWWNPLLLILVALGVPRALAAFRTPADPSYYAVAPAARATVAACYFGLAGLLFAGMLAAHVGVPAQSIN